MGMGMHRRDAVPKGIGSFETMTDATVADQKYRVTRGVISSIFSFHDNGLSNIRSDEDRALYTHNGYTRATIRCDGMRNAHILLYSAPSVYTRCVVPRFYEEFVNNVFVIFHHPPITAVRLLFKYWKLMFCFTLFVDIKSR